MGLSPGEVATLSEKDGPVFLGQQVLAVLAAPFTVFVVESFSLPFTRLHFLLVEQGREYYLAWWSILVAVLWGIVLPTACQSMRGPRTARWTWLLPLCINVPLFAVQAHRSGVGAMWADVMGAESLVFYIVTMPILSAISYSIGAAWAHQWRRAENT